MASAGRPRAFGSDLPTGSGRAQGVATLLVFSLYKIKALFRLHF